MIIPPEHLRSALLPQAVPQWHRLGWAGFAGVSVGVAVSRLLYESNPHQFSVLGGLWPTVGMALLGGAIWAFLMWLADRRPVTGLLPAASLLPILLVWCYILTPPMQVDPLRGSVLIAGAILISLALASPWMLAPGADVPEHQRWIGMIGIGIIAFAAYLLTLQRTIGRADTFEFQVTAPVLGIAHPTGYPLYILLGKFFSLLPLGKIATRVNVTSALFAAMAVMMVYITLRRVFNLDRFIAGLAALAFGLSPIFWSQAVIAEVYALNSLFVAMILGGSLWLVVRYQQGVLVERDIPIPAALRDPAKGYPAWIVIILFTLVGLSLTNHLTTVLMMPAFAAALVLAWPRLSWKQWALAAGLFAAALLIYLYLPIRWPALHDGRLMRPDEFIGWVTGSQFAGALHLQAFIRDPERWRIVGRLILDQYGWLGAGLGLAGFILMAVKRWRGALISGLAYAAYTFYGLNYLVPDIGVFLIPLFLIQAIWMGFGIAVVIEWVFRRYPLQIEAWVHAVLVTLFAIVVLRSAWTTGSTFDWSDEIALEAWGRRVLAMDLAENGAILADSEKIAPLEYLHRIEGMQPDMSMVVLGTEADYQADLQSRLAQGQTVYLARFLPGLEGAYSLRSVGPLIEVSPQPLTETIHGDEQEWVNGIALLHAESEARVLHPGDEAWITLYWQAEDVLSDNYQVQVRLVDQGGQVFWQSLPTYPVSNRYPTVAWKENEVVSDFYAIPLPYTMYPGVYTAEVSLAPPFSQDISILKDGNVWAPAVTFEVESLNELLPLTGRRLAVTFAEGALAAVDAESQAPIGGETHLTATWLTGRSDIKTDYILQRNESSVDFPVIAQTGELRISAQMSDEMIRWEIGGSPVRCGWMQPRTESCLLATMRIEGQAVEQAVANFDNKMLLTEVEFEAGRLEPGQMVDVTLTWQTLSDMDEDYTVFVHLLGPDGLLHGQIDAWPVQGTYPTSTWQVSEVVEDRYLVMLDTDAPSGAYQLEIGVYLLSTNTRLPILSIDGLPIDDKVLLSGLLVP